MDYSDPSNWHEAAKLFPLFSDEDLRDLTKDIKENGLLNPVVLFENQVLDGRNRLLACGLGGVKPKFTQWVQNGTSPLSWVISQNLFRRQLTAGQKAAVAVEAKPMFEAEAKRNQTNAGANNLAMYKGFLSSVKSDETKPIDTRREVAKKCDVSEGYVGAAQRIKDRDEPTFQKVKSGALSIPEAEIELGFRHNTRIMVSSETNEWYTPEDYILTAKKVLGFIDLDPASCVSANNVVGAARYFSKEDDGLEHPWAGKVWLNPPYADLGPKFVKKLLEEYEAGNVTEAILLVNSHSTDAKWFEPLFQHTVCFTNHRSRFWNEDGVGGSPTHGSLFAYLGPNKDRFALEFGKFGSVLQPYSLGEE